MKALSIRQPHLLAMLADLPSPKRIENRERVDGGIPTPCLYLGPLLLHASGSMTQKEFWGALDQWCQAGLAPAKKHHELAGKRESLQLGGIVGQARAIGRLDPDGWFWDIHPQHAVDRAWPPGQGRPQPRRRRVDTLKGRFDLRWWGGGHALVLADVKPLPFVKCKGQLGIWTVPDNVLRQLGELVEREARHAGCKR